MIYFILLHIFKSCQIYFLSSTQSISINHIRFNSCAIHVYRFNCYVISALFFCFRYLIISVLLAYLLDCFSKDRSGFFIVVGVCVLFVYITVSNLLPQSMFFNPFNFVGQFIKSFRLVFPRITILLFVITNILLPAVAAFVDNTKVATV